MHIPHRLARATAVAGALIATGTFAVPSLAAPAGKTRVVRCKGTANGCKAVVSLAGGASNVKLKVQLTDTDFALLKKTVSPKSLKGAYSLTRGKFVQGGSVYTATLNAVQSIGRNGKLTLTFGTR